MLLLLQLIFPYLILFYLIDCIIYINDQHLLFSSLFGNHFKLHKAGLHFYGLLPISQAFISHKIPIFLTSVGIYLPRHNVITNISWYRSKDLDFISYEDITKIDKVGKLIKVNGEYNIKFPSSSNAIKMAETILELKYMQPSLRLDKIRAFLDTASNLKDIRIIQQNDTILFYINLLSSTLFAFLFVILPLVIYSHLAFIFPNVLVVLSISALLYVSIIILTIILRNKMNNIEISLNLFVSIILSPVTATHIHNKLMKDNYTHFDYSAIAAALLPSSEFQRIIREELLQIEYGILEVFKLDLKEYFEIRENMLKKLLADSGISFTELFATPKRMDSSAACYCPICLSEYSTGIKNCIDCNILLKDYD